jgi:hypothetical protein
MSGPGIGQQGLLAARKIVLKQNRLERSAEMKHVLASLTVGACLLLPSAGSVFAGQPGSSAGVACGGAGTMPPTPNLMTPGQAASAPGSVFNEPAPVGIGSGGVAGGVYAGQPGTPSLQNGSAHAVSQYDVACLQVTTHQPP